MLLTSQNALAARTAHSTHVADSRVTAMLVGTTDVADPSRTDKPDGTMQIRLGRASFLLTGPWQFHVGDNAGWAAPDFNDSRWESMDLTPAPGAHDGDVGLTDYVPGWWARGHKGYTGYAWYRLHVTVDAAAGIHLALLAPAYVEDAYQVFWNGTLIGGSGDFSGKAPVIYGAPPKILRLPTAALNHRDAVIAIRVWMPPGQSRTPDAGGIHIPPTLGTDAAVAAQYQREWLETFYGYVVEVAVPLGFVLLAILAWCFRTSIAHGRFVPWLCAALLLTAAFRLNQAVAAWTPWETLSVYLVVHATLIPLALAAWIMAWRHWYQLERWRWLTVAIAVVTLLAVVLVLTLPDATFAALRPIWRVPLALVLFATILVGLRRRQPDRPLVFFVALLAALSQFGVLQALGVPGIWFPFGIGVTLTQYLYAALIVGLTVMLIRIVQRVVARPNAGRYVESGVIDTA